jgi:hypothetical protein
VFFNCVSVTRFLSLICNERAGISVMLYICTEKAPVQIFIQISVVLADSGCFALIHEDYKRTVLLNRGKLPIFPITFYDHLPVILR